MSILCDRFCICGCASVSLNEGKNLGEKKVATYFCTQVQLYHHLNHHNQLEFRLKLQIFISMTNLMFNKPILPLRRGCS